MKQIASALVKAQRQFGPALKTNTNPAFRSKYADLSACVEAVIDALNENGIMLSQRTLEAETGVTVETVFLHESGEQWSSGPLHVPASKQDPQGYGSALTYARRYSLMASCGIAPEDDDGNAASKPREARVQEPKPKGLPEKAVADHLAAIDAATKDTLKAIYGKAKAAAIAAEDHASAEKFLAAQKRVVARLTTEPEDVPF